VPLLLRGIPAGRRRGEFDRPDLPSFAGDVAAPAWTPNQSVGSASQINDPFAADVRTRLSLLCVLRC
jgi:hypothetical protein